jgi:membrane fusion protein (multidrug efflux system)
MNYRARSLLIASSMAGIGAFLGACGGKEAAAPPAPPEVLVTEAATRDVPVYREWIGTLDGSENAEIRARVNGYLIKRNYQEGSLVKKGDVLFEIDPRPFEAALAEAKSQLDQAIASQVATQADADRSKTLFAQKAISEKEYINKTQLNESAVSKIDALKANVEQAQLNLNFCKVESPVDGIAGISKAQVGDLVGTGANAVLTSVSTLDPMKILFPISESDYLLAAKRVEDTLSKPLDQRPEAIELILADGTTFPNKARLLSVDRQVNAATGTILVTALVQNPGSLLRPGFFAKARIVAQVLKDAVVIPQRAVSEVQGSYQLGIVTPEGKAEIRPIKVGTRVGTDWVISSGLKPGEKVVVEGLQKIKAGAPVVAKPWTPPSENAVAANSDSQTAPK